MANKTHECFRVEVIDKVGMVTMIRPERSNSMIPSFWTELPAIVDELSNGGNVRAMVLAGEGRNFCSGMDLEVFGNSETIGGSGDGAKTKGYRSRRNERFRSTALKLQDTFTALERARMPVLSAIQGACVGGGIDMVSATDMRYTTENAWFSIHEINIGMTADVGTLQRLPHVVPEGIAREMAYLGQRLPAQRAYDVGLVNGLFETHDELVEGALGVAAEIASKSPMAVWGCKQVINYSRDHSVADGLEYIAAWQTGMFSTDDMAESFGAMTEGREAKFPDLGPRRLDIG
ncbi:MAG: crotonase/enoyl-CoA hydratase family protein [Acidimicrobiaceae bacterium]|nr:crotonase/enoyl-CoA hydratase family protein [Acidimicrobiaceae bacterium]